MDNELVTFDGFPLTGITREGAWKRLGEIDGWFGSPDIKRSKISRPRAPGSFRTPVEYDNRLITYNGRLTSSNHGYIHEAATQIAALGNGGEAVFLVRGHGQLQWAMADLRGPIVPTFPTDTRMEFQIPLEAIDPFKYGEYRKFTATQAESVAVFHRGSAPAWPRVVVSGSMPGGYTLTLAGQSVVVTQPLVSGAPHTIDFRKRRLYRGGAPVRGGLSTASYAQVFPGQRDTFSITPGTTGTASATLTLYDTYI